MILAALLAIGLAFTVGVFFGRETVDKPAYSLVEYSGVGSGVLKPGTVLTEQYASPMSIAGELPGLNSVYILENVK